VPVKEKIGIVVSNKMQKTVVVKVESRYPHPIYSKTMPHKLEFQNLQQEKDKQLLHCLK
jgi:small subunit ribosomal protein S17